jgi:hypothetical protein
LSQKTVALASPRQDEAAHIAVVFGREGNDLVIVEQSAQIRLLTARCMRSFPSEYGRISLIFNPFRF